ncbi:hypothetical protein ADL15_01565 [Actinoplanes awajinensis subsp. mycoplanecinus]|uniref:Calx-beta domain-containing protein n=1 Tax=Actinoplanes awajinensis subsp. mycoplanecinus TaxID=135947 RepID=A0A0X3VBS8_9ACTN|nr:hypothetical protein ADL15_01565 [Actinoplanes awajinensis subsp. mycoplanecinus]
MPVTFWGRPRIRTVLATVVAAAVGMVPAVMVGSPALAANPSSVDNLTISNAGSWEGSKVTFTITYTGAAPADFTFAASGGTATGVASFTAANPGAIPPVAASTTTDTEDYSTTLSRTGTITFPGTSSSGSNTITISADTQADAGVADETFNLVATDTLGNTKSGTGTIWAVADADYPTYTVSPSTSTVAETASKDAAGATVQKKVTVTATLNKVLPHPLTIPVATADGGSMTVLNNAVSGGGVLRDYDALPSTALFTIPEYTYTGTTTVQLYDDNIDETATNQSFTVNATDTPVVLKSGVGANTATIAITDDDAAPVATIGDAMAAVTEGGALNFPVTLDRPSDSASLAIGYYATAGTTRDDSTAAATADITTPYTSGVPGSATIPAYATTRTIAVPTDDDGTFEGTENIKEVITGGTGVTLGTKTTAVGLINDNDPGPDVALTTVSGASLPEGDSGEKVQKLKLTIDAGTYPVPIKIDWATKDGTAKAGSDYKATSGTVTIPAGVVPGTWKEEIPVTLYGDTVLEGDEAFDLAISSSTSTIGNAGDFSTTITEFGEGDAKPTFNVGDVSVTEGNSGTTLAQVPITLTGAAPTDTVFTTSFNPAPSVDTAVDSGTLAGDNDYDQPTVSSVTIKAGDKTGTLSIPINGDTVYEKDQKLTVGITTASSDVTATDTPFVKHLAVVTIGNDDAQPTLVFTTGNVSEGQSIGVTGKIVGVSEYPYNVGLTVGGAATNPATVDTDFTAPDTLATATVQVPRGYTGALTDIPMVGGGYTWWIQALDDQIDEPAEGFNVTANEKTGALTGFANSVGTYKIADDPLDLPPAASIGDVTVSEKDGTADVPVNLTFTGDATSTVQNVTLQYDTADGTAKQGKDYKLTKGTLTVPPGTMKAWIKVPVIDDWDKEDNETFSVRITNANPQGAQIVNGDATVTVTSDDSAVIRPTLDLTSPAKGIGSVVASGKAAPGATVELWGAPLPVTDPLKTKWLVSTKADASGNFKFGARKITQGWTFVTQSQETNSTAKQVRLTQNPALTATSTKGKLTVSVVGNPKATGQTVTIQRWTGGKWVTLASGKTTSTGYKGSWSFKSKTKVTVRAMVSGNSSMGINSGYSASKAVTIK